MNVIHLQRTSAFNTRDFEQCLLTVQENDAIVLIDDGCYNINHPLLSTLKNTVPSVAVYYIQAHADARGIQINSSSPTTPISMKTLVDLTFQYGSVITWQ